jgi:hypothetical protein
MDQPSQPNAAAMHNVQRRRGSVGTSQLFDNIVSTSNCTSDGFWDVLGMRRVGSETGLTHGGS